MDITDKIIEFEMGDLSGSETLELFSELIRTGMAWSLQGIYGWTARALIEQGLIDDYGTIDWDTYNDLILM
jgi:hypothetical protein